MRGAHRRAAAALLAIAALIASLAVAPPPASARKHDSSGLPPATRTALRAAAVAIAAQHGDARPDDIEAVRTTHRRAERLLCGQCEDRIVPQTARVYVVAMRGHFNCSSCPHPPRAHFGPATVITLQFLNPADLRNHVFGYGGPYPRLRSVGTPARL